MNDQQAAQSDQRLKQLFRRENALFVWICIWTGLSSAAWIGGWVIQFFNANSGGVRYGLIPSWFGPWGEWVTFFAFAAAITFLEWLHTMWLRRKEQRSHAE